jgi:TolA-binding protein
MSLKETVENNIIVFLLGALVTGFGTGWAGYVGVQHASGMTPISTEHLNLLEDRIKQSEGQAKKWEDQNKQLEDQVKQLEDQAVLNSDTKSTVQQLKSERADLQRRLLQNRRPGQNYVTNVSLSPASPAVLKVHDQVVVKFDYVFAKGENGDIYAIPKADVHATYEASFILEGTGSNSRFVYLTSAGRITAITIHMDSVSGEELYSMTIPVTYIYK